MLLVTADVDNFCQLSSLILVAVLNVVVLPILLYLILLAIHLSYMLVALL